MDLATALRLLLVAQELRGAALKKTIQNAVHVTGLGDGEYMGPAPEHGHGVHYVRFGKLFRIIHESAFEAPHAPKEARAAQEAARAKVAPPAIPRSQYKPAPSLKGLRMQAGVGSAPQGIRKPEEFDARVDHHRPLPDGGSSPLSSFGGDDPPIARYPAPPHQKSLAERLDIIKSSYNAKAQKRALTPEQSKGRMVQHLRQMGFRLQGAGRRDQFGMGKDQRGVTWNENAGSPGHEVGHALMTPEGQTLREHQQSVGGVSARAPAMTQQQRIATENAAFNVEPLLARRAGAQAPAGDTFRYHWKKGHAGPPDQPWPTMEEGRAQARAAVSAHEEGRRTIDPKGKVVPGTGIDGKINASAAAGGGTGPLLQRLQQLRIKC